MNVVLYSSDMEPITVIDLPMWCFRRLNSGERIHLCPIIPPLRSIDDVDVLASMKVATVSIWGEVFIRRGKQTMMLFTDDDEAALMLLAGFLPGQRRELSERDRAAVARGFATALNMLSR